jgi:hypothetical protein
MIKKIRKLKGLNKRPIAIDVYNVIFLEEHELDGNLCTNVHFSNGKWVTAALSLDEVCATMSNQEDDDSEEQQKIWRENAIAKRKLQQEVDLAYRVGGLSRDDFQSVHSSSRTDPDGKTVLTVTLTPKEQGEP